MTKKEDYSKEFEFDVIEDRVNQRWLESESTLARPDHRRDRFVVMMPLPNVTGALHMGHAMDNVMQDLLTRWHRMRGDNTLWMPGTDHAGIATQAVVEKRIFELEGKTRHDIGREGLVKKIWEWKDEYEKRIVQQQQKMGCSCDWTLHRFTMDRVCRRAVLEAFYRLFAAGLIFRGHRLVNWDCHLQTAISDDEIIRETTRGNFWHVHYPVENPRDDEPRSVTVATTRPETMLGDTAVAVHPDPAAALESVIRETRDKWKAAGEKERVELNKELERLRQQQKERLPQLLRLVRMAREGRRVILPLMKRSIPLILDPWAKPELGSGCVKITPAHDPNDYEVWLRHRGDIDIINLLNPDGTYNEKAGCYRGLDRLEVRRRVVEDLRRADQIGLVEEYEIELGYSDRSKTPIEPFLSKQWFVNMGDIPGGVTCGKNTSRSFKVRGLAQAGIDAVREDWQSPTGRRLTFHPDAERYQKTFVSWLAEKRDWCISRQLWWGHEIPIWHGDLPSSRLKDIRALEKENPKVACWISTGDGELTRTSVPEGDGSVYILVCLGSEEAQARFAGRLENMGLVKDPDVLDTWFSSALWPFSTLGWPDPDTAEVGSGNHPLGKESNYEDFLSYYYPGSCLVTARDIITLWVARMTIFGLYFLGDIPFTDCFIHATIQDGKGERMSKSKGNGIDPIDIIQEFGADAMRYVLCDMQTGNQDIRLPVQAISPFTGEYIELANARHGQTVFTYIDPKTQREFDVLGTLPDLPRARITSTRFNLGKAFCIKLWNAVRFALLNLDGYRHTPVDVDRLTLEDRWILSRLARTIEGVSGYLDRYLPSGAIGAARDFFWSEFCDWYLEIIKPRIKTPASRPGAQTVLALVIDRILRLFHPFVPYITEALWERLRLQAPARGLREAAQPAELLIGASWPEPMKEWVNPDIEKKFRFLQKIVRTMRDLKSQYQVSPRKMIEAVVKVPGTQLPVIDSLKGYFEHLASVRIREAGPAVSPPPHSAVAIVSRMEIYLLGLIDPRRETAKLTKKRRDLEFRLEQTEQKLANSDFVNKAPERVVKAEQQKREDLRVQIEKIRRHLDKIDS